MKCKHYSAKLNMLTGSLEAKLYIAIFLPVLGLVSWETLNVKENEKNGTVFLS